ncbi:hypothetical protein FZEAL_23 [Fusarium zealandicum]|uniref:Ecp2 effector protein domain-containing protein n=1 Tax=Fusarium zealandicum TaxID=1053134 RepID=A0A8H4UW88_9HYPO|nr:hypothetical protein FZEAL_23 [Fusarium zealandicum]
MRFTLTAAFCALAATLAQADIADFNEANSGAYTTKTCASNESCLGPVFDDAAMDGLCNEISGSPCSNHGKGLTTGLLKWVANKDCDVAQAKITVEQCREYVIGTRAMTNDAKCGIAVDVLDTTGKYHAGFDISGQCLVIDPIGRRRSN